MRFFFPDNMLCSHSAPVQESKNRYRKINKVVAELLWLELIWLIDWWAGVKVLISSFILLFKIKCL